MKNKEFEAKVVIACILIIAITICLGIVFKKNEYQNINNYVEGE